VNFGMMDKIFVSGILLGFSIAAPVGPIGALCIQRSLNGGLAAGLATGLGAATADALYGLIAAFGLTVITGVLTAHTGLLGLAGGLFLCYLGIATFRKKPPAPHAETAPVGSLGKAYLSTLFLTLTNPMTILAFTLIFSGLEITRTLPNNTAAAIMVGGVFLGSGLWWILLSGGVSLIRQKFTPTHFQWVNKIAGTVITGFGVVALLQLAF
jgi:threonine/homoserine/homoserine lactone efflux protein